MTPRTATKGLTTMQGKILKAIKDFFAKEEMPPTVREIGDVFGLKSSTVFAHLKALEQKGFISRKPGKSRGIHLAHSALPKGIPLLGNVPAGPLDLAVESYDEYINIDARMFGEGEMFALRICGESMIEAGILDGDTVIVSRAQEARDGQIIVARIEEEATVKRLRRSGGAVLLEPANCTMEPLFFPPGGPEPQIIGKVVGVLRRVH
jgi:repressor LexA